MVLYQHLSYQNLITLILFKMEWSSIYILEIIDCLYYTSKSIYLIVLNKNKDNKDFLIDIWNVV
jgi:hypothetical protein